ncbi:hypothetical protein HAX54_016923 [Datura stramonium]|uniref:Uncharacterized protein n=1 Tax=Datura stramonium TaxID=4076 RepID=A0ABS8RMH7_DATST|nr:hypothetical protein [Datura stramonium]
MEARKAANINPLQGATQPKEPVAGKISYAKTLVTTVDSTVNLNRKEKQSVVARRSTHNGMPAIIFKAKIIKKWTLDFKPEEDIPIAIVWALLPELPFHMYSWEYVK